MKKGISLVALVITIIVLIILTGAVILSFQDGGIIDRADQAVEDNNDAVLEEKITMMNLEYTQKLKKKFTPETRATLKAIVEQSGIDLDKLLVYYDKPDGEQHVFYKIDKVTKSEVEWFLENEVEGKKIYFLLGDINLDGDVDKIDYEIVSKVAGGVTNVPELPRDDENYNYEYQALIADLNCDYGEAESVDSIIMRRIVNEGVKYYDTMYNTEDKIQVKEEQIKTYFGIE